ncbi:GGDEF domain-containing protein [Paenibacillus rhizophilus]|uniref:GGDEF domain-containing protein n=1 Tax=Paenibacillus rhizophilus TaxID=1850366 RepID=A0A3N9P1E9_9BACL|nr:GGDEF domain-containing protein [Paenibacillus rhizophilus]RQW09539.1 GGDEF domain-containing protein [Paenibacillus rhizophilus]
MPHNDTRNHQTGDAMLIEIGKLLQLESSRQTFAVRWGGDEFLLCGLCSGYEEVESIKHRLNTAIAGLSASMNLPVNISIGSALYPDDNSTLSVLITLADSNMYNEKKA